MRNVLRMVAGALCLMAVAVFGEQGTAFFRIVSPTNSQIKAFGSDGTLVWTNASTAGVTCTVQRATTLAGPSNWVDYVKHPATNATMAARIFDPNTPSGMVLIPAGSFSMGDGFTEASTNELPVHTVYVSAFYMDKTEVTKAKWDEVYAWAVANGYSFYNAGSGKASGHPVQKVSWYDCVKWCNARSEKEGRTPAYYTSPAKTTVYRTEQAGVENDWVRWDAGYRLPTEAEWEKAARGGLSGRRFPWGDTIQHAKANYYSSTSYAYDTSPTRGYHPTYATGETPYTTPADAFAPNGYGLYGMAGNVWEWCWDRYGSAYYGTSPESDPRGPVSGSFRVLRGGSWCGGAICCRSAYRYNDSPDYAYFYIGVGFRAVLPPGQQ